METTLESLEDKAQAIFRTEAGLEGINPDFCYARIPEGVHSVGVQGDERAYGPVVILNVTRTPNGLKGISRVNITLPY